MTMHGLAPNAVYLFGLIKIIAAVLARGNMLSPIFLRIPSDEAPQRLSEARIALYVRTQGTGYHKKLLVVQSNFHDISIACSTRTRML